MKKYSLDGAVGIREKSIMSVMPIHFSPPMSSQMIYMMPFADP